MIPPVTKVGSDESSVKGTCGRAFTSGLPAKSVTPSIGLVAGSSPTRSIRKVSDWPWVWLSGTCGPAVKLSRVGSEKTWVTTRWRRAALTVGSVSRKVSQASTESGSIGSVKVTVTEEDALTSVAGGEAGSGEKDTKHSGRWPRAGS